MILYASLIFQIAMDLGNVEDIRAEFAGLPQNLDEAYVNAEAVAVTLYIYIYLH